MKRWLLAAATLLGLTVSLVRADYVIIIANLSGAKVGNGGQPGGGYGPGPMGPGGGIGPGPMGPGGGIGPMGPGGGIGPMGPGGGFGPGPRGPGGGIGPMGPGGGIGPMGPGGGIGPMGPGGGFGPGPMGPGGGPGPMGPGLPPLGSNGEGGIGSSTFVEDPLEPIFVVSVIETKTAVNNPLLLAKQTVVVNHKWGFSSLIQGDSPMISLRAIPIIDGGKPFTLLKKYNDDLKELKKTNPPDSKKLTELIEFALTHGLTKEFNALLDEANTTAKDNPMVKALVQVRADLDKPLPEPQKELEQWKEKLKLGNGIKVASKNHYLLLHTGAKADTADSASKLDRLEEGLRRYYYWFAFKGKPLPLPPQKLLAILPGKDEDFAKQHQAFDSLPLISDGFVARRENLVIFSPNRLDQQYSDLMTFLKPSLANGADPAIYFKNQGQEAMQTLMLLRKSLKTTPTFPRPAAKARDNC